MIESLIQTSLSLRTHLVDKISNLEEDTFDIIPEGFETNIRWNIAHMIAMPALLTYELLGETSPLLSQDFTKSVNEGTTQENFSLNEDYGIKHLSEFLIESLKQIQRDAKDLEKKDFKQTFETPNGYIVKDMESALSYTIAHDGIHIGTILAMLNVIEHNA